MLKLLITSAALFAVGGVLILAGAPQLLHADWWLFILFLTGVYAYGHDLKWVGADSDGLPAFNAYMKALIIRFFVCAGMAAVYLWKGGINDPYILTAVLNFFIVYFIFLIVEVSSFLSNLRPNSKARD